MLQKANKVANFFSSFFWNVRIMNNKLIKSCGREHFFNCCVIDLGCVSSED